jgi:hypothetical protein
MKPALVLIFLIGLARLMPRREEVGQQSRAACREKLFADTSVVRAFECF